MISNYLIYLYTLPKEEQVKHILIFIIFFFSLSIVCIILDFLKSKFLDKKNHNKSRQNKAR